MCGVTIREYRRRMSGCVFSAAASSSAAASIKAPCYIAARLFCTLLHVAFMSLYASGKCVACLNVG